VDAADEVRAQPGGARPSQLLHVFGGRSEILEAVGMKRASAAMVGLLCLAALQVAPPAPGDEPAAPRRGRLEDQFLQNLVGDWTISRKTRGTVVTNSLNAEWVLQHRFVQLHMKDVADPPEYEALVLIGYDGSTETYVALWCDTFGGQYAAAASGKRVGNSIEFIFNYADGPFHNTFSWDPAATWTFLMEAEGKDGKRQFFAEDTVRRK
jgi:hypothetical protein